jgi:hypothetical protein
MIIHTPAMNQATMIQKVMVSNTAWNPGRGAASPPDIDAPTVVHETGGGRDRRRAATFGLDRLFFPQNRHRV